MNDEYTMAVTILLSFIGILLAIVHIQEWRDSKKNK